MSNKILKNSISKSKLIHAWSYFSWWRLQRLMVTGWPVCKRVTPQELIYTIWFLNHPRRRIEKVVACVDWKTTIKKREKPWPMDRYTEEIVIFVKYQYTHTVKQTIIGKVRTKLIVRFLLVYCLIKKKYNNNNNSLLWSIDWDVTICYSLRWCKRKKNRGATKK